MKVCFSRFFVIIMKCVIDSDTDAPGGSGQQVRILCLNIYANLYQIMDNIETRVISTNDVARLVDSSISRQDLIYNLQQCAHLVQGVWVLQSDFLFQNLPPAYSNIPGKVNFESFSDLLLIILYVVRLTFFYSWNISSLTIIHIFQFIVTELGDCVLNRIWNLLKSNIFKSLFRNFNVMLIILINIFSPDNLAVVLQERRYWMERWNEVQRKIDYSTNLERTRENNGLEIPNFINFKMVLFFKLKYLDSVALNNVICYFDLFGQIGYLRCCYFLVKFVYYLKINDGLSDSGIVKDKLDAKCSIASGGYWTPRETLKKQKELTTSSQDYNDIEMKTQSLVNKGSSASHIQLTSGEKKTRYSLPDKDWKDFNLDYLDVAKLQLKRMSEDLKRQFIDSITASTEYGFDKIIKKLFCFDYLPDIFSSKSMF
uniref:Uncharacterized protein n=1 Tax=Heterorhabditis bacteriophora TaxID=37862 RepID=A0A1I7X278_HETBA